MLPTPDALDPTLLVHVIAALAACFVVATIFAHAYRDEARRWRRIAGRRPRAHRSPADAILARLRHPAGSVIERR